MNFRDASWTVVGRIIPVEAILHFTLYATLDMLVRKNRAVFDALGDSKQ
jgi:hypothetical protein